MSWLDRNSLRHLVTVAVLALGLLAATGADAQLDESCTVSALNRTARVLPDGSWVLPNVPANLGRVRVRATCVADGVTRSGQSDYFEVPTNGIIQVAEIRFDVVEQVPDSLALAAPVTTLASAGQEVPLTATATYPDGTRTNVSAATEGTTYVSSNPATASVGPDGLVTAHRSGNLLVSATNEGTLAVLRLSVILAPDSDGDGLPDDFEIANGLDPNNPVDVLDDPDADGLSTGDEFQRGLDPFVGDTDGDDLLDGEEVTAFGTDPLLFDTDGDGISDGLEVASGSDPLDPTSFDLSRVLIGIEAQPSVLALVFDTALGESSRRLRVVGRLADGTELDLLPTRYGTTYASSDLTVASFGAEPGRIFAGQNGSATVTVANAGFTAQVNVDVTTFSPTALAFLRLDGHPNGVAVDDGYAYVASGGAGLHVVDVTNPASPRLVGTVDTPGNANDVRVSGPWAYVADGGAGLVVVDVADPMAPAVVGVADTPGDATDLVLVGDHALVADGAAGVQAVDVGLPAAPVLVGFVDTPGIARGIDADGTWGMVADAHGGVHVLDLSDPSTPTIAGSTHTRSNGSSRAADVAVRGSRAWVADGSGGLGGLKTVDFRVPGTPVVVGASTNAFGLAGVALDDRFAITSDYYFVNGVPLFDLGGDLPAYGALLDFSGPPSRRDDNGNGVATDGNGLVFLAGTQGIRDNGSWGYGGLHVGRYRTPVDTAGIAPQVALVAPTDGTEVLERRSFDVTAEASDDFAVALVEFLVDGELVATDAAAPFEARIAAGADLTELRLSARAWDYGSNSAVSDEVTVSVLPDDAPSVALLAPVPGTRQVEGSLLPLAADASDDAAVASVAFLVDGAEVARVSHAPYRFDYRLPVGPREVLVEAVAYDDAGQSATSATVRVELEDDADPLVEILEPSPATVVVAGARLRVTAGADDDVGVARVRFLLDGALLGEATSPPYEIELSAPTVGTAFELTAVAVDTVGQTSQARVTVTTVPDPGTRVEGLVLLPDGTPAAGATVAVGGVAGQTDNLGRFALDGVPTVADVQVRASLRQDGITYFGSSERIPPLADGVTAVGEILLREGAVVGYYDLNRNRGNSTQRQPILDAGFEAVDVGDLRTTELAFDILFAQNPSNSGYSGVFLSQLPRLHAWIENGGVLVLHDRHVSSAGPLLPGNQSSIVRSLGSNIDVLDDSTPVTDGPGGVIGDGTLDGGNWSHHGYAAVPGLPVGALPVLSTGNPDQAVTFAYPYGEGWVVYSSIPLDFYLTGSGPTTVSRNLRTIYAPNVLTWAASLP